MKRIYTVIILMSFALNARATIYIDNQEDLDRFPLTHFSNVVDDDLSIYDMDIMSLDSLYNIDTIYGTLTIYLTNISDLSGLHNLKWVSGGIDIQGNFNLVDASAIMNIDHIGDFFTVSYSMLSALPNFTTLDTINRIRIIRNATLTDIHILNSLSFAELTITNNELLSDCSLETICEHIQDFGKYEVFNNAPGCSSRAEILEACMSYVPCEDEHILFADDFEHWNDQSLPPGWIGEIDSMTLEDDTLVNIQKHISEQNGQSLKLNARARSSYNFGSKLSLELNTNADYLSINFNACFEKLTGGIITDKASISVNGMKLVTFDAENENYSDCVNFRNIDLCYIPIINLDQPITIEFVNEIPKVPANADFTTAITSSWIIDDLTIKADQALDVSDIDPSSMISFYPNPVHDRINIQRLLGQEYTYRIIGINSTLLTSGSNDDFIDVAHLNSGMYLLELDYLGEVGVYKFVKL